MTKDVLDDFESDQVKRLNPATGKPFERCETRDDGFIFIKYSTKKPIKKDGYFREEWHASDRKKYGNKRFNPLSMIFWLQ